MNQYVLSMTRVNVLMFTPANTAATRTSALTGRATLKISDDMEHMKSNMMRALGANLLMSRKTRLKMAVFGQAESCVSGPRDSDSSSFASRCAVSTSSCHSFGASWKSLNHLLSKGSEVHITSGNLLPKLEEMTFFSSSQRGSQ